MEQYSRGGLTFDVIDDGPQDGPVVVLLHGFPEQNISWEPLISRLTAQGYRCLAPNQRGYSPGARPTGRWAYRGSELAADVVALIDAVGAQRVHLVGHDWGATVAWYVAQQYPDRLLSMSSMSVPHPGAFLKSLLTSRQFLASWYIYLFQLPRVGEWYFLTRRGKISMSWIAADRSRNVPELVAAEAKAMEEPGAATAAINWYRAIPLSKPGAANEIVTVPTMFIWSDGDIALLRNGAELTEKYVSADYRFEVLEGTSHWILDERLDDVTGLLLNWFAAHPARP